ncbi:MAG TPA: response regulator transcription factor, partial [Pseudomonadaceae bacterium]|nr:response regulator transcription factor [Pseudomonadaceae bacterium]
MRLLVVEDEDLLRARLVKALADNGYVVDSALDGKTGLFHATEYEYDAAIIDLGLPELDGISLIRAIREAGCVFPVLILTARDNWTDKVEGLDAGADDFVVKPCRIEEILARLNALLRRAAGFAKPVLEFGPLKLDTTTKLVSLADQDVELTAYEYKVLEYLMLHPG